MAINDHGYYWIKPFLISHSLRLDQPISPLFWYYAQFFSGVLPTPKIQEGELPWCISSQYLLMIPHSCSLKPPFQRFPPIEIPSSSPLLPGFWCFPTVQNLKNQTRHATPVAIPRSAAHCAARPRPAPGDAPRGRGDPAGRGARGRQTARRREWCAPGDELVIKE